MKAASISVQLGKWRFVLVAVLAGIGFIFGCKKVDTGNESPTEFDRLIANRPIPDLTRLAERSSPSYSGEDATESFYDILKLREVADANAIPVLAKTLAKNVNTRRIHGYAAAQALFCIGTPEAHNALAKYMLTNTYEAGLGIRYTSAWGEMDRSKRTPFIERYHLINLSKDLELKLDAARSDANAVETENVTQYDFTLTLRNISGEAFSIREVQVYQASMLYFQSETGDFICGARGKVEYEKFPLIMRVDMIEFEMPSPQWFELEAGASHRYNIQLHTRYLYKQGHSGSESSEDSILVGATDDFAFALNNPGAFKVYAMFEQQPLPQTQINQLGLNNPWSGRAVSKPITVKF